MARFVVAIDQGTTGTTVLVLDEKLALRGRGYREFPQHFPQPGWVEHDPEEIWAVGARRARRRAARLGRATSTRRRSPPSASPTSARPRWCGTARPARPLHHAIVWQDRRTADLCAALKAGGLEARVRAAHRPGARSVLLGHQARVAARQRRRRCARAPSAASSASAPSTPSWCGGSPAARPTSPTSRTRRARCCSICTRSPGPTSCCELLRRAARACCPRCAARRSATARPAACPGCPTASRSRGIAGDQQAALFGQACFAAGDAKCTYGTGAFLLMNTGERAGAVAARAAHHRRLEARRRGRLRARGLGVHRRRRGAVAARRARHHRARRARSRRSRASVPDSGGVVVVPALAGLGAPHWRPEARGLITGLTRGTTTAHLARATLEGIALQIVDLLRAMQADAGAPLTRAQGRRRRRRRTTC